VRNTALIRLDSSQTGTAFFVHLSVQCTVAAAPRRRRVPHDSNNSSPRLSAGAGQAGGRLGSGVGFTWMREGRRPALPFAWVCVHVAEGALPPASSPTARSRPRRQRLFAARPCAVSCAATARPQAPLGPPTFAARPQRRSCCAVALSKCSKLDLLTIMMNLQI
jgi:hypothetical protein